VETDHGHLRFRMTIQAAMPTTMTSRMGTQTPPYAHSDVQAQRQVLLAQIAAGKS
jgi:hypothetical protein